MSNQILQSEGLSLAEIQEQIKKLKEAAKVAKEAEKQPKPPIFNAVYKCVDKEGKKLCDCPGLIGRADMVVYCGKHQTNKLAMQPCIQEKTYAVGNRKKKDKEPEKISGLEFEESELSQTEKITLIPADDDMDSPSLMIE